MLSTKQNEIMKIFTILAFVTLPLSLIAAVFGMNTTFIPIVGLPNDFWIIIGIMIITSLAMFAYFKYKKWI
jgi:magnesium transporter